MGTEVKMPQLGETVVEGTITRWLKSEGDRVEQDELIVEISTDKVDSEIPSSASGVLEKILVPEGETVQVGTAIAIVSGDSGAAEAGSSQEPEQRPEAGAGQEEPEPAPEPAEKPAAKEQEPEPAQQAPEPREPERARPQAPQQAPARPAAQAAEQQPIAGQTEQQPAEYDGDNSKRGIISPLVRRLADEHGVDLARIRGTGTGGRIRKTDVLAFVDRQGAAPAAETAPERPAPEPEEQPAAPARPGGREEAVPWTNIRRRTAEHMLASHLETARAWNAVEADWTRVVALRTAAKKRFSEREGFNLTYLPFLARALCDTLLEMPEVNATFDEANHANIHKHYVNLGIAVALEGGGLIVPVVKAADEKNIAGVARAINDIVGRSRAKKLSPDDLAGGTFTITNPGPFGSVISVPIIPRGQTAILGFEAIQKRVVVTDEDALAIRSMGFLTMSWDHRVIDGAEAARFLARLRDRIEKTDFTSELAQYL